MVWWLLRVWDQVPQSLGASVLTCKSEIVTQSQYLPGLEMAGCLDRALLYFFWCREKEIAGLWESTTSRESFLSFYLPSEKML